MGAKQFYNHKFTFIHNKKTHYSDKAQVELPILLLEKLILSGLIPGNECKCLDDAARKTLWNSMLQGSIQSGESLCL